MKRDMDLVRKILIQMDEYEHGFSPQHLKIEGYSDEQIGYHCYLMGEAGLIENIGITSSGDNTPLALPKNLTWAGHEFLDNSRDPDIWKQAKDIIVGKIGNASFAVWTSVLTKVVLQNLGLG